MTSKHYRWQTRWRYDPAQDVATHDSGLVVRFTVGGEPSALHKAVAANGAEIVNMLRHQHGPHNAPRMIERWLREAEEIRARERWPKPEQLR